MKKIYFSITVIAFSAMAGFSGDFAAGASRGDFPVITFGSAKRAAEIQRPKVLSAAVKISYEEMNRRMKTAFSAKVLDEAMDAHVVDARKPVIIGSRSAITVENLQFSVKHANAKPSVTFKPYFVRKNVLGLAISKYDPGVNWVASAVIYGMGEKNAISMEMGRLTDSIVKFIRKTVGPKMKDPLAFSYDKEKMELLTYFKSDFISPFAEGVGISGFSFDDEGATISINNGEKILDADPRYNIVLGDELLSSILRKTPPDSNLSFAGPGGIAFTENGLAISGLVRGLSLGGENGVDVRFSVHMTPSLLSANNFVCSISRIQIDGVYRNGQPLQAVPPALGTALQQNIISVLAEKLRQNKYLSPYLEIAQTGPSSVRIGLKQSSFLPAFGDKVAVDKIKLTRGVVYLHLALF